MISKLRTGIRLIAKIVAVAVVVTALVYGGAYASVSVRTQARCAALSWAHSIVTYDFHQYCYTIYSGSEAMGPVDEIEKLAAQQQRQQEPSYGG